MEEIIIHKEDEGKRIDSFLSKITDISRTKIGQMIKKGDILVHHQKIKTSYLLKENDDIQISEIQEEKLTAIAEDIPLCIVYEDDDVIVVDKPNKMVVHPAIGNHSGTLVNALLHHSNQLSSINGEFRPGIVHRIDADTTGLLMVAKNDTAHQFLAKQLEEKTTTRKYIALVWGVIQTDTGTIDAPIGRDLKDRKKMTVTDVRSKPAVTHFKVLKRYNNVTLIELTLETGRTHQIRVHMNYIGHPVVNDPVYGRRKILDSTGQCLHAKTLGFIHPTTKKYMEFESPLPDCFCHILNQFTDLENKSINLK